MVYCVAYDVVYYVANDEFYNVVYHVAYDLVYDVAFDVVYDVVCNVGIFNRACFKDCYDYIEFRCHNINKFKSIKPQLSLFKKNIILNVYSIS